MEWNAPDGRGRTWAWYVFGLLALALLSFGLPRAAVAQSRPSIPPLLEVREAPSTALEAALVSQRPDPRGCLLAAAATAMNLVDLRAGRLPGHTYREVWERYDQLVPGFAGDVYAYPYPWTIGRLVDGYGAYRTEAREGFGEADVEAWLAAGLAPIVYLDQGKDVATHSVVVLEQNDEKVRYFDPWWGVQERRRAAFYRGLAHWVTVIRPATASGSDVGSSAANRPELAAGPSAGDELDSGGDAAVEEAGGAIDPETEGAAVAEAEPEPDSEGITAVEEEPGS